MALFLGVASGIGPETDLSLVAPNSGPFHDQNGGLASLGPPLRSKRVAMNFDDTPEEGVTADEQKKSTSTVSSSPLARERVPVSSRSIVNVD